MVINPFKFKEFWIIQSNWLKNKKFLFEMINYIKVKESTRNKNGKENGKKKKKKRDLKWEKRMNKVNKNKIQTKLGKFELHIQIGNK